MKTNFQGQAAALKALCEDHIKRIKHKTGRVAETVQPDPRWTFHDTVLTEEITM